MNNNMPHQMPNFMPYMEPVPNFKPQIELGKNLEKIERELEFIEKRLANIEKILTEKNNIYSSNVTENGTGIYML